MNEQIKSELEWRETVVNNIDALIKHGNTKNNSQLSLFGESHNETISLSVPEQFNYKETLARESEVLGVNLTYDIFDKYILVKKRFCNANVQDVVELTETADKILFLATVKDIDYRKSDYGNNYAKITLSDNIASINGFLFGDRYKKLISKVFKDRIYLIEISYNAEKNSIAIVNMKDANEIDIKEYVSSIVFHISGLSNAIKVREYIVENMFCGHYSLGFNYDGLELEAPYTVRFEEENYLDLKEFITDITIKK